MRSSIVVLAVVAAGCGGLATQGALQSVATTVCASGMKWTGGNAESPQMNPGQACIACHTSSREGPTFRIAGTVYADLAQPDDCAGTSTGVTIAITDANGAVTTLTPNAAGNFYLERGTLALPYKAKLIAPSGERVMAASQTNGDCNSCHTAAGTDGAPGRIAPL